MRFLLCAGSLILSQLTFAQNVPPACPEVQSIKASGIQKIRYIDEAKSYGAFTNSKFNSKDKWTFFMIFFEADNDTEAMNEAVKSLKTLSGTPKPEYIPDNNSWTCSYEVHGASFAIANNPGFDINMIKHFTLQKT